MRPLFTHVALLGAVLASCEPSSRSMDAGSRSSDAPTEVWVHAATSTRAALLALEAMHEGAHGIDLIFNFGGSGALARQIVAGGKADLFLSADEVEMDRLEVAGLLEPGTRVALLSNQLVVVEPAVDGTLFAGSFDPHQLAQPGLRLLSLGDPASVPAGRYAKAWLESRGAWEGVESRVLPAIDVRAALAAVEAGGAQAGIVYRTDVARSSTVRIVHAVPLEDGPRIVYSLALLRGRANPAAVSFARFLGSVEARARFAEQGFVPPSTPSASAK